MEFSRRDEMIEAMTARRRRMKDEEEGECETCCAKAHEASKLCDCCCTAQNHLHCAYPHCGRKAHDGSYFSLCKLHCTEKGHGHCDANGCDIFGHCDTHCTILNHGHD